MDAPLVKRVSARICFRKCLGSAWVLERVVAFVLGYAWMCFGICFGGWCWVACVLVLFDVLH